MRGRSSAMTPMTARRVPPAGHLREGPVTWEHFAENLGNLGFELGDDPGRGAVVTFDSGGKAMVLVRGAETPREFVDPVHDYLVQAFGLNLDRVAAHAEAETANQIESSGKLETMA